MSETKSKSQPETATDTNGLTFNVVFNGKKGFTSNANIERKGNVQALGHHLNKLFNIKNQICPATGFKLKGDAKYSPARIRQNSIELDLMVAFANTLEGNQINELAKLLKLEIQNGKLSKSRTVTIKMA